ncbi:MAG: glycogen/starch synthase [Candidatus Aphodosoma sp.]
MSTNKPDFILETSWEVCNKVGGIYTVLSTRAKQMMEYMDGNVMFIGPDIWKEAESPYFEHTAEMPVFATYMQNNYNLPVRIGRWAVPGHPVAVLVDFTSLYQHKNDFYRLFWNEYQVDSLHAYGNYDESSMFGTAAGMVMAAYVHYTDMEHKRVVAHFNEWMTGFGLFYLLHNAPQIATVFTTHATTTGRSIAGNGKPLYDYMTGYHGDQMARELNVESKHSVEKRAAHLADCFTTVSQITDDECAQLLERRADIVTPNGFELDFVPESSALETLAEKSRKQLTEVAENILGYKLPQDIKLCATSGRYEYKNKGIDVYINVLNRLNHDRDAHPILAYILVPAWHTGVQPPGRPSDRYTTHCLAEPWNDPITNALSFYGMTNAAHDRIKVIFVPAYLHGNDGIFNVPYYDLLAGFDFTVFPSYYEPWGYTPMESAAFGVPTITTNLSGFGRWVNPNGQDISAGVGVVARTDNNFDSVSQSIAQQINRFITDTDSPVTAANAKTAGKSAQEYARCTQWEHFFASYRTAYQIAMEHNTNRVK